MPKPVTTPRLARAISETPPRRAGFEMSGWIAGESLMGLGLVIGENGPDLVRKLFGH